MDAEEWNEKYNVQNVNTFLYINICNITTSFLVEFDMHVTFYSGALYSVTLVIYDVSVNIL